MMSEEEPVAYPARKLAWASCLMAGLALIAVAAVVADIVGQQRGQNNVINKSQEVRPPVYYSQPISMMRWSEDEKRFVTVPMEPVYPVDAYHPPLPPPVDAPESEEEIFVTEPWEHDGQLIKKRTILTRKIGETLVISDDVTVKVLGVQGNQVRLGVKVPKGVAIDREEMDHQLQMEKGEDPVYKILNKRVNERLVIGDTVKVSIFAVKGNEVLLGVDAPKGMAVYREEIEHRIQMEKGVAE